VKHGLAGAATAFTALVPIAAHAQAIACRAPDHLPTAQPEPPGKPRIVPVGGYTLVLSWSPEYCRFRQDSKRDRLQCGGQAARFGFVLHGLWPDGRGDIWPEYCRAVGPVPEPVLRATLCTMPSVDLQQHEWAKHGSCAFPNPTAYFRAARTLYAAIRHPDMVSLSRNPEFRVASFAAAFAARNGGLTPGMMRARLDSKGWLEEVMLCLDGHFRPTDCRDDRADRDLRPIRIWRAAR
jgi:ribonuclease T2